MRVCVCVRVYLYVCVCIVYIFVCVCEFNFSMCTERSPLRYTQVYPMCSHLLRRRGRGRGGEDPLLSDLWLYESAFGPHQTPKIGPNIPPQDAPDAPKQTPKIEPQKEAQNGTPYFPKMCPKPYVLLGFWPPKKISRSILCSTTTSVRASLTNLWPAKGSN